MATEIRLERVVRTDARGRPTGKVHLTALVPDLGDVRTLCGKSFPVAAATGVDGEPTCQACLRRQSNPSLVSAALFEAGLGAKLLELSLQKVGESPSRSRPGRTVPTPAPPRPRVVPGPPATAPHSAAAPPPARERPGELRVEGLREVGEDLYRSPAGVLLRLRRRGDAWLVAELVFEGSVLLRRRSEGRLDLRAGDIQVELEAESGAVRAAYAMR